MHQRQAFGALVARSCAPEKDPFASLISTQLATFSSKQLRKVLKHSKKLLIKGLGPSGVQKFKKGVKKTLARRTNRGKKGPKTLLRTQQRRRRLAKRKAKRRFRKRGAFANYKLGGPAKPSLQEAPSDRSSQSRPVTLLRQNLVLANADDRSPERYRKFMEAWAQDQVDTYDHILAEWKSMKGQMWRGVSEEEMDDLNGSFQPVMSGQFKIDYPDRRAPKMAYIERYPTYQTVGGLTRQNCQYDSVYYESL